jgi:DNA-binding transcriptional regulator YbjK
LSGCSKAVSVRLQTGKTRRSSRQDWLVPKIVDRESRRTEIAEAYLRVVARDGADRASTRAVAAELGVAAGALWHYFLDFDQLLARAFQLVFERTTSRILAAADGLRGLQALRATVVELIPTKEATQTEAFVVVGLWGRVPSKPELGGLQSRLEAEWRQLILTALAEAASDGELVEGAPLPELADLLLVVASGLQVEYVLRSDTAQPERQLALVGSVTAPWLS